MRVELYTLRFKRIANIAKIIFMHKSIECSYRYNNFENKNGGSEQITEPPYFNKHHTYNTKEYPDGMG